MLTKPSFIVLTSDHTETIVAAVVATSSPRFAHGYVAGAVR
jgi:hypothetical protein